MMRTLSSKPDWKRRVPGSGVLLDGVLCWQPVINSKQMNVRPDKFFMRSNFEDTLFHEDDSWRVLPGNPFFLMKMGF
jgi:hypothetical protein